MRNPAYAPVVNVVIIECLTQIMSYIHSLYVYFGNTVHIKIVQIMHRSCKLILKDDKKIKIQYYTQYNSIVKATKYHATKPIYQIEVETETNRYHE